MIFDRIRTRMQEKIIVPPSYFGSMTNIIFFIRQRLAQMYIHLSCPMLGIGLKISNISILNMLIDPDSGSSIASVEFSLTHLKPQQGKVFHHTPYVMRYDVTFDSVEEKIVVYFPKESQDGTYVMTLCQYMDPYADLVDPNIRLICIAEGPLSFV